MNRNPLPGVLVIIGGVAGFAVLAGLLLPLLVGCDTSGLDRPPAVCEQWAAMQPSGYTAQKPTVVCVRWGVGRTY